MKLKLQQEATSTTDDAELDQLRQIEIAMRLRKEDERRQREREMIMMAMHMAQMQAISEEERLIKRAIEESKEMANDPTNPDVDNMTYEQLLEMGENAGKV